MEATTGSDPKLKPLRVCLQAGECCFAACWAVLQGQHIKTHPRVSDSVLGMAWVIPSGAEVIFELGYVWCS